MEYKDKFLDAYDFVTGPGVRIPLSPQKETQGPWIDYSHIKKISTDEQSINLTKPTMSNQHKIAVFTVTRNEKNEIISSEFYKEGWIELDKDQHVALIAAKKFKIPVDLFDSIVVKKVNEVTL